MPRESKKAAGKGPRRRNVVARSIARLELAGGHQTAWLFSEKGEFVTAGHGLVDLAQGDRVDASFQDGSAIELEILEKEHLGLSGDESRGLDYAVLVLVSGSLPLEAIALPFYTGKIDLLEGKEFLTAGYRAAQKDLKVFVTGQFVGVTGFDRSSEQVLQLAVQEQVLDGLSGGPICVLNGGFYEVVGIQSFQSRSETQHVFAYPVRSLRRHSRTINRVILEKEAYGKQPLALEPRTFPRSKKYRSLSSRRVLIIVPIDPDHPGKAVFDQLAQRWHRFAKRVQSVLRTCSWLSGPAPEIRLVRDDLQHAPSAPRRRLAELFGTREQTYPASDFRVVLDFCDGLASTVIEDLETVVGASHLISLGLRGDSDELAFLGDPAFDLRIELPLRDEEVSKTATVIESVIEDVYFDCAVFNSAPILCQLFQSAEAKRAFSLAKVAFAETFQLSPWGLTPKAAPSLTYMSLASYCRKSPDDEVDLELYRNTWEYFTHQFLLRSLGTRRKGNSPSLSPAEIYQRLGELPSLGAFSLETIQRRLRRSRLEKGQLGFVVFTTKRPSRGAIRNDVKYRMGYQRFRIGMVTVEPVWNLGLYAVYSQYIQCFFFRFAGWHPDSSGDYG